MIVEEQYPRVSLMIFGASNGTPENNANSMKEMQPTRAASAFCCMRQVVKWFPETQLDRGQWTR